VAPGGALEHRMTAFTTLLGDLQRQSGRSQRAVAQAAGLDPGRYSRILSGAAVPASREQVQAIASGLGLGAVDTDRLVAAAGYLPPSLEPTSVDDPALAALLTALRRPTLDEASRQALRQTIIAIAEHWR
jgi:transcriptional regulator with XRE-family HTH domain